MGMIVALTFVGVFALIALPLMGAAMGPTKESKQVMTTLDSAVGSHGTVVRGKSADLRKDDQLSSIPWLNRRLLHFEIGPQAQTLLDQANLKWTAGRFLVTCGVCGLAPAYLIGMFSGYVWLPLIIAVLFGSTPVIWVLIKRKRRFEAFVKELPEALDLMVNGLRAGHSLIAAINLVATECPDPVGPEFKTCFDEQNYGLELKSAMENMIRRVPVQDLRIVTSAIMIQKESGGNLAEVLNRASHAIRERFRLKRQIRVHTAQGRLTGIILTILPIILGIAIYFVNPEMMSILWKRPLGIKLLWGSGGLTALGGLIIRRIVNMDV